MKSPLLWFLVQWTGESLAVPSIKLHQLSADREASAVSLDRYVCDRNVGVADPASVVIFSSTHRRVASEKGVPAMLLYCGASAARRI